MEKEFRDYNTSARTDIVKNVYYLNHTEQTVERVKDLKKEFSKLGKFKMSLWDAVQMLNELTDDSDPDLSLPQSFHCYQTAEMIRNAYPEDDWFHLVGFIHDLGKVLMHPKMYSMSQYMAVGDTFPLGCAWSDKIVHFDLFADNPDSKNQKYQTKLGIYEENIGFDSVLMSWGHDEYFYQVCIQNNCKLPPEALYIIRYHSFYPQHQHNAYDHLASDYDKKMMEYVRRFQKFDLYSKDETGFEITQEMEQYYQGLMKKYFPDVCCW